MAGYSLLDPFYNAVTEAVIMVNRNRRIVYCNYEMAVLAEVDDRDRLYGLRPGKAFCCIHTYQHECGTTEFCGTCGAAQALSTAVSGREDLRECTIRRGGEAQDLELLVKTTPFTLNGGRFIVFAAQDVSPEKRRRALERSFFHDTLNTATGIKFLVDRLAKQEGAKSETYTDLCESVENLLEEIRTQRDLAAAEAGNLEVRSQPVGAYDLLHQVCDTCSEIARASGCDLALEPESENPVFLSDPRLIRRVLTNMVVNAVEATEPDETVVTGTYTRNNEVLFWVHNSTCMSRESRFQVFKPSFTTKEKGRGWGTYGMKLLTEEYLGGRVSFESTSQAGTTFYAAYPRQASATESQV